jgi:hypothetical protein
MTGTTIYLGGAKCQAGSLLVLVRQVHSVLHRQPE